MLRRLTLIAALSLPLSALAGLEEGVNAWRRGDYPEALRELRPLAEANQAQARYLVGLMQYYGDGLAMDRAAAFASFKAAADAGLADAMVPLAHMYQNGETVPADAGMALKLLTTAAEAGYPPAQADLGIALTRARDGIPPDIAQARDWLEKAAARNQPRAMRVLGQLDLQGLPVRNEERGLNWLKRAAGLGDAEAMYTLGRTLLERTKPDLGGLDWMEKASAAGLAMATAYLGAVYEQGRLVTRDIGRAQRLLERAARDGDPAAQTRMGQWYAQGLHGVPVRPDVAASFFRSAAGSGIAAAQTGLAELLEERKAWGEARDWYRKALGQGDGYAALRLGMLEEMGLDTPPPGGPAAVPDPLQAYVWYRVAAAYGKKPAATEAKTVGKRLGADRRRQAESRVADWLKDHPPRR